MEIMSFEIRHRNSKNKRKNQKNYCNDRLNKTHFHPCNLKVASIIIHFQGIRNFTITPSPSPSPYHVQLSRPPPFQNKAQYQKEERRTQKEKPLAPQYGHFVLSSPHQCSSIEEWESKRKTTTRNKKTPTFTCF